MGFFSWITSDTQKSIPNVHSNKPMVSVTMIDHHGNKYFEDLYEGYGEFGGKDFYTLVDEMNGGIGDRQRGIKLYHPPSLANPKHYSTNAKINILQDDGEYKPHTIKQFNKITQEFLKSMPDPVKSPILVEDDTIEWGSDLRPAICPSQGYWYAS
tara:strand:- start:2380 stop:2844 length:465 start_codon:yes stop_codon:yes gene_type:complete